MNEATIDDPAMAATVKARADGMAQVFGAGYRIAVHWPDLHLAAAFETDGVEAIELHVEYGRPAFDRMALELIGERPAPSEHSVAERIPGECRR